MSEMQDLIKSLEIQVRSIDAKIQHCLATLDQLKAKKERLDELHDAIHRHAEGLARIQELARGADFDLRGFGDKPKTAVEKSPPAPTGERSTKRDADREATAPDYPAPMFRERDFGYWDQRR